MRDAFWQDEVSSARIMLESDSVAFVRHIARTEATPPLWYALGWVAHQLVGVSPGGFRWTSVLAGGFLAATAVVLAARLLPLWASFFAGLLVAFGWQFVFHGRELRAYELLALEAVLLALAVEAASSRPTTSRLAALGAVVAAGSLTNYFFLLSVSAALIWLWIEPTKRRARRAVTIAIAAGGIPLVIWSPILIHQYRGQQFSWIGPFDVDRVLTAFWLVFVRDLPENGTLRAAAPAVLLVVITIGVLVMARMSVRGRLYALLVAVPFVVEIAVWAAGARVFDTRNLIGAAPFAAVAIATALSRLPRLLGIVLAATVVALVIGAYVAATVDSTVPYDRVARSLVAEGWTPESPIVLIGDFFSFRGPLQWYLPDRPALTLAEPGHGVCTTMYVVAEDPSGRQVVARSPLVANARRVDTVWVGTIAMTHAAGVPWRRAKLLASVSGHSPCVRAVPETDIITRLRHRSPSPGR